jgi:hypothetical protein
MCILIAVLCLFLPELLATHFVGDHMEGAFSGVQTSMFSVVAPRKLLTVTTRHAASMVFYTDGSLIDVDAQGLHFIGLGRVVLDIRYRVRLVFLLRSLLLCL